VSVLITPTMVGQVVISGLLAGSIYAMVALGLGLLRHTATAQDAAQANGPDPRAHFLIGHKRHRRHFTDPMTRLAFLLEDRRDLFRKRQHRLRDHAGLR